MTSPVTFAAAVLELVGFFDGSVTSWVRTRKRNAKVGGVPNSPHTKALGADVVWDEAPSEKDYRRIVNNAKELGLRVIREKDHDHLQPLDWEP